MLKIKPIVYKILIIISVCVVSWSLYNIFSTPEQTHDTPRIYDTTFTLKQGPDSNHDGRLDTVELHRVVTPRLPTRIVEYASLFSGIIIGLLGLAGTWLSTRKSQPQPLPPTTTVEITPPPIKDFNTEHIIFSNIDTIMSTDLQTIKIGSDVRTDLFRTMIKIQLEVYRNKIQEFLQQDHSLPALKNIRTQCTQLLLSISKEYEQRWEEVGVPKLIIERYSEIHYDKIKAILGLISNDYINDTKVYIHLFLSNVALTISSFISIELLTTLADMNGKVKKLTFKGKEIL